MARYTTDVHVPRRAGEPQLRVRLTVTEIGALVWCELYEDGELRACGPGWTTAMLPAAAYEAAVRRVLYEPIDGPLYQRAEVAS